MTQTNKDSKTKSGSVGPARTKNGERGVLRLQCFFDLGIIRVDTQNKRVDGYKVGMK